MFLSSLLLIFVILSLKKLLNLFGDAFGGKGAFRFLFATLSITLNRFLVSFACLFILFDIVSLFPFLRSVHWMKTVIYIAIHVLFYLCIGHHWFLRLFTICKCLFVIYKFDYTMYFSLKIQSHIYIAKTKTKQNVNTVK